MKKQGRRGEGTIYREESGRWHGQLLLPNGKRKSVYGTTQREVQRKMTEIKREVEAGMHTTTNSQQTLRQYTDSYLINRASILRPRTYNGYISLTRNHLGVGSIGDKALTKITPQDIHDLYTIKFKAGLSSTTVGHLHAMLRVILKSAVKLGIIPRNPTEFVDAPPLKPKEITPLSEHQVKVFLNAIKGHSLESLYTTILGTGMRMGEFLGLQWPQVDITQKRLRVRTTLHRYDGIYVLETTKARKSRRELPLSSQVITALMRQHEQQRDQCKGAGNAWEPEWNLVFCTDIGTPISPDHIRYAFRQVLKAAKLPAQTRVHDLRHTFATLLLERGVNIRVVSELLGHSSVAITLAIYGHVTPKMQDTALEHITHILQEDIPDDSDPSESGAYAAPHHNRFQES